jgi:hypothetical protein
MSDFLKSLGDAVKDRIAKLNFWQFLMLVVVVIFSVAAAQHLFP